MEYKIEKYVQKCDEEYIDQIIEHLEKEAFEKIQSTIKEDNNYLIRTHCDIEDRMDYFLITYIIDIKHISENKIQIYRPLDYSISIPQEKKENSLLRISQKKKNFWKKLLVIFKKKGKNYK